MDFLPVVLLLLIGFTLMLPLTLGFLLFRKRKHFDYRGDLLYRCEVKRENPCDFADEDDLLQAG